MIKAYFDGSATGADPTGANGIGWVVFRDDRLIEQGSRSFRFGPPSTNNVAEYSALVAVLKFLLTDNLQDEETIVFGDSKLVIEQMFGTWKMRGGMYSPFAKTAQQLLKKFSNIRGEWIAREYNTKANDLANEAYLKKKAILLKEKK